MGNLKIGQRLFIGFMVVILITAVVGIVALFKLHTLAELTNQMYLHPLTVSNAVRDIRANINAMHRSMKDVALAETVEKIDEAASLVDSCNQQVHVDFDIVFIRFLGNKTDVMNAHKAFVDWKEIRDEVIELSRQGKKKEAVEITRAKGAQHVAYMTHEIQSMIDFTSNKAATFLADAQEQKRSSFYMMTVLIVSMMISGVVISIVITRSIVEPLHTIVERIRNISQGNLKEEVDIYRNDEVGVLADSFRELQNDLKHKAQVAEQIASGDFSTDIFPRSEKDDLGKSFFAMTTSLRKATQELKESEQNMHDLVYIASHDLQSPIVSMVGFAGNIIKKYSKELGEDGVYAVQRLKANAEKMHKLVLSLLDISRLNTVKNPHQKINPGNVMKDINSEFELLLKESEITITAQELPVLKGDLSRITSVFRNLVVNAINYGGKNITVGYENGNYFVRDDGIGISKHNINKIFKPGERLKRNNAEGVGMGLTFCQKVIRQHNGKMWAESEGEDMGSIFYFTVNTS